MMQSGGNSEAVLHAWEEFPNDDVLRLSDGRKMRASVVLDSPSTVRPCMRRRNPSSDKTAEYGYVRHNNSNTIFNMAHDEVDIVCPIRLNSSIKSVIDR